MLLWVCEPSGIGKIAKRIRKCVVNVKMFVLQTNVFMIRIAEYNKLK